MNRQKHEAHCAICHDARTEFARTLFVHAHHFVRGIFSALGPPQVVEIFFLRQSVDENRLNDVSENRHSEQQPYQRSSDRKSEQHPCAANSFDYILQPDCLLCTERIISYPQCGSQGNSACGFCRRRRFCFAAQNKPQNMIEFSALLCYNIEDYTGIYCHYCFRSVFVADKC